MLRKENDEIQQIKNQVKELTKEVEALKLQLKLYASKAVISELQMDDSENSFARSMGKIAGNAALGNDVKQYAHNKQMLSQMIRAVGHIFNNNANPISSFSPTTHQNNYQQAQNLKNMSHRL